MSLLNNIPTDKLWGFITKTYGDRKPELAFTHALIDEYAGKKPDYIPYYELKKIITSNDLVKSIPEKQLIDFLCFDIEILELYFRLIDEDDNHFDIDLEMIQEILSGNEQTFGNKKYSTKAIKDRLFTCFTPTQNFLRLLEAKK